MNQPQCMKENLGIIGAGNMAQAIVAGMLKAGIVSPDQILVSAPTENNFAFWGNNGIKTTHDNVLVLNTCDVILLAMKPQYLDEALENSHAITTSLSETLFISILAGVSIDSLGKKICNASRNIDYIKYIVRVMPNTPIMVGTGATVFSASNTTKKEHLDLVRAMFSAGGICEMIPENLINAAGALAGSGPAYVYLMIEALCDGAVKMGIPRALASQLACQTLIGASTMVRDIGRHPGQLKDEVCSPGGSTIAGMHVLEQSGVRAALMGAVEAATKRSSELGSL